MGRMAAYIYSSSCLCNVYCSNDVIKIDKINPSSNDDIRLNPTNGHVLLAPKRTYLVTFKGNVESTKHTASTHIHLILNGRSVTNSLASLPLNKTSNHKNADMITTPAGHHSVLQVSFMQSDAVCIQDVALSIIMLQEEKWKSY